MPAFHFQTQRTFWTYCHALEKTEGFQSPPGLPLPYVSFSFLKNSEAVAAKQRLGGLVKKILFWLQTTPFLPALRPVHLAPSPEGEDLGWWWELETHGAMWTGSEASPGQKAWGCYGRTPLPWEISCCLELALLPAALGSQVVLTVQHKICQLRQRFSQPEQVPEGLMYSGDGCLCLMSPVGAMGDR